MGECNNVRHSRWGNRGAPFLRLLSPSYADGKTEPRRSSSGYPLPNPVELSRTLQNIPSKSHESVTALLGAWSELLLHDLASTGNLKSLDCCKRDRKNHGECFGDLGDGECREYMRTLPSVDVDACEFRYRNQINLASSFLDASAIYGNTYETLQKLRIYDSGLVNVSSCTTCQSNALYSAILKEHNRLAVGLAALNRHWTDDVLFYESKRIVTAEIQHITYNEFLPTLLGQESITNSELSLQSHGRYAKYSSLRKAGVYNEVAMGVLPALLSMLPNKLLNETANSFAEMVDILISLPAQSPSLHMMVPLRKDWDTAGLFIHMGRDHGIPGYTSWMQYCSNITYPTNPTFEDMTLLMKPDYVNTLKRLYQNPEDVDLLVGALLEEPLPGSVVGSTLSCLLKEQFVLLKESDRFWYENDLPPSSLTMEQIKEIKKVSLAGLLCANTDDLDKIQPKAFVQEDTFLNARINCNQHPMPNLTEWAEMDHMADVSEEVLMEALAKAEQELLARRKMEYQVFTEIGGVDPKSPQGIASSFSKPSKNALALANTSLLFEFASNEIVNSLLHTRRKRQIFDSHSFASVFRDDISEGLQNVDISSILPGHILEPQLQCEDNEPCDPAYPYRSYSGYCNNLKNPKYGNALTTFNRLLPSAYDDGISKPRRVGVTGVLLPNPRLISRTIHADISNLHKRYTLMVMQFAQFIDHDLTFTPIHKGFDESIPSCRSCDSPVTVHPECDPIPIPPGDSHYPEFNITTGKPICLPFMRSLPGQKQLGPREQVNMNTAFLDGSMVYGSSRCTVHKLKGLNGKMNVTIHPKGNNKDLLPRENNSECRSDSGLCFYAGDGRASEQPGLTMIHTLYVREHNRVMEGLQKVNPHWNEEKIFEQARKIVIGGIQHVVYNEFLPRILGWNAVNLYGLKLLPQGYYKDYNPSCNPSIFSEFGAAAFRIGHSLLRPHIPRLDDNYQIVDPPLLLRDFFFNTDYMMNEGLMDQMARGLVSTPMETLDQFITGEITNHLFEDKKIPFSGVDLIALNIKRARDHGIPSYNNYRALCNLKRATTFEDLAREIPMEVIQRLKALYPTVDDIDLFPGGMSERPLQGGIVGPTFGCIIAIQFRQLRKCDRFWYENEDPIVRFSEAQLAEMRKITLAKILCDNMDAYSDIQRAAFELPSNFLNPRVPCNSLPTIDFNAWRESRAGQGCIIGTRHVQVGESAFPSPCTSCVCTAEGGNCASLKVTDCRQLLQEWPREAISRDEVCTAQCGFLFKGGADKSVPIGLVPPALKEIRPRHIHRPPRFPVSSTFDFSGFKFPNLSPFIN
ncbi:peroxidasin homolog isoform X2 [Anthonomus grandis grandis]|nr:peroxidasin homolog isoform X2 [Anthonomus grandis grandis]